MHLTLNPDALFPWDLLTFVDPDDYTVYDGTITPSGNLAPYSSLEELESHIINRRDASGLAPLPNARQTILYYNYILGEIPKNYFIVDNDRTLLSDVKTAASIALSLSRDAMSGVYSSAPYGWVSRQEANRRARICASCPFNVQTKKSLLTQFNDKVASLFTLSRTTDYDDKLHDCSRCGCPLPIKVHYSPTIIKDATKKQHEFPDLVQLPTGKSKCWIKEILDE